MEKPAIEPTPAQASSNIARLLDEAIDSVRHLPVTPSEPPLPAPAAPDPRLATVAKAVESGDWRKVASDLGAIANASELPPALGVVCALAHHEVAGDAVAQGANELAIRSVAALFGVTPDSPIALVLAKRLLRKNPVAWRARPAPPAKLSFLIVAATLALGSALGWLLTSGVMGWVRIKLHL